MKKEYLEAGKIVAVHGVRGEVKLLPWTDGPEFLLPFETLYLDHEPMAVEQSRVQKTCLLLKLRGVDTVEQAAALVGKIPFFARNDPAIPAGTVFISDLIGLPVRSEGKEIGKIAQVLPMPAAPVYVIRGEKEYMVPAVPAFVPKVDPDQGWIDVNLIEGMETDAD